MTGSKDDVGASMSRRHIMAAGMIGSLAAGLCPVWLDRWNDPWTPPAGVVRITTLTDLI